MQAVSCRAFRSSSVLSARVTLRVVTVLTRLPPPPPAPCQAPLLACLARKRKQPGHNPRKYHRQVLFGPLVITLCSKELAYGRPKCSLSWCRVSRSSWLAYCCLRPLGGT